MICSLFLRTALNNLRARPLSFIKILIVSMLLMSIAVVCYAGIKTTLIILVAVICAVEFLLHFLFRTAFGKYYRRVLINYSIIDHQKYGYTLRPQFNTEEVTSPVFDRFLFQQGATLSYDFAEDKKKLIQLSVNSKGFRGKEFKEQKEPGVLRIFCSGGSTTAGDKVNDHQTWPAYLEQILIERGNKVEVINAGVFGWYSFQELSRFREQIQHYSPDIILLHQGWNEEFEFSSQHLGRHWKPESVRSNLEANYFYTSGMNSPFFEKSLLAFFGAQSYFKNYIFEECARFSNEARWDMLLRPEYVSAWIKNLYSFNDLARKVGASIYTIDYPCLARCMDTVADRKIYYNKTRLTPLFADYQALSKARISHVLRELNPLIPFIDAEKSFHDLRGDQRVAHFIDEIHLSALGNRLLAEQIAEQLLSEQQRGAKPPQSQEQRSKDSPFNASQLESLKKNAVEVPAWMVRYVESRQISISSQLRKNQLAALEVPTDRYTTF